MPKIELNRLKKIIREELSNRLVEGDDHNVASKQMTSATKLLNALEVFKADASAKAKAELGQPMEELEKLLNRVIASPMQYVDVTAPPAVDAEKGKKVSLKPAKSQKLV